MWEAVEVSLCAQHVPSTCPNTQLCDRFSELVGEYFVFRKYLYPFMATSYFLFTQVNLEDLLAGLSMDLHFLRVSHPDTM